MGQRLVRWMLQRAAVLYLLTDILLTLNAAEAEVGPSEAAEAAEAISEEDDDFARRHPKPQKHARKA